MIREREIAWLKQKYRISATIWNEQRKRKIEMLDNIHITKHGTISRDIVLDRITIASILCGADDTMVLANLMIDTGANITVVRPDIIEKFAKEAGIVTYGISEKGTTDKVTCRLRLENEIIIDGCEVHAMDLEAFDVIGIDGVIGMDIIQAGDLHVFRKDGFPHFEFTL